MIFADAVRWLRERRVLLPGVTTLARIVARERDAATARVWAAVAGAVDPGQARRLPCLLDVPEGSRQSEFDRMRKAETVPSGVGMVRALDRVSEIAGHRLGGVDLSGVPQRRVAALARYGMAATATALRRHPDPRRLATLVATVRSLEARSVDDALELFDVLMTNDLLARASRASRKEKLRRCPRLSRDAGRLAAAVGVLLDALEREEPLALELIWEEIESKGSSQDTRETRNSVFEDLMQPALRGLAGRRAADQRLRRDPRRSICFPWRSNRAVERPPSPREGPYCVFRVYLGRTRLLVLLAGAAGGLLAVAGGSSDSRAATASAPLQSNGVEL